MTLLISIKGLPTEAHVRQWIEDNIYDAALKAVRKQAEADGVTVTLGKGA